MYGRGYFTFRRSRPQFPSSSIIFQIPPLGDYALDSRDHQPHHGPIAPGSYSSSEFLGNQIWNRSISQICEIVGSVRIILHHVHAQSLSLHITTIVSSGLLSTSPSRSPVKLAKSPYTNTSKNFSEVKWVLGERACPDVRKTRRYRLRTRYRPESSYPRGESLGHR